MESDEDVNAKANLRTPVSRPRLNAMAKVTNDTKVDKGDEKGLFAFCHRNIEGSFSIMLLLMSTRPRAENSLRSM